MIHFLSKNHGSLFRAQHIRFFLFGMFFFRVHVVEKTSPLIDIPGFGGRIELTTRYLRLVIQAVTKLDPQTLGWSRKWSPWERVTFSLTKSQKGPRGHAEFSHCRCGVFLTARRPRLEGLLSVCREGSSVQVLEAAWMRGILVFFVEGELG